MDMVIQEKWSEILTYDELNREIAAKRVLNNFTALQPSFPPTFKRTRNLIIQKNLNKISTQQQYDINTNNTNNADNSVSNYYHPKRIPSYTDRILYKSLPIFQNNIKNLYFESCEHAISSDHKPVRAGFEININKGKQDILIPRNLLNYNGKISKKTSGLRTDVSLLRMVFSDLKGENLEEMDSAVFGGGSDPYIIITTDPSELLLYKGILKTNYEGMKSSIIYHNLNPIWKEEMNITLGSIDLKNLSRNASIIISVWDYDRSNADDLIGITTIPIRDILKQHSFSLPYTFNNTLYSNTEIMGKISGKIEVQGSFNDLYKEYLELEQERNDTDHYITLSQGLRELNIQNQANCQCSLS